MDLVDALAADRGLVCVVGAGGKKTALYALADRLDRAVVTATVRIPIFDDEVAAVFVTDTPGVAIKNATDWPVGVVPERERADRYRGYDPAIVADLADAPAEAVLVKADGARNRLFKAPGDREPQLPGNADTVLPIASARVVGKPLDEQFVHRPERVAALTGLDPGEEIRPEHVATVLASERGGRKDVPAGATVIPVVNMVDDADDEAIGREIARGVLDRAPVPRVVLTTLIADEPVVAVVE
ncbi:MAG: selenium cofactor biosynthesis protein YqeC [Haloarculaceae archaeon]